MTLKTMLSQRIDQLSGRHTSISVYLKDKKAMLGKVQFTKKDLEKVEMEIEETQAAISGIKQWEQKNKYANTSKNTEKQEA